jgi:hypothetical protein
MWFDGELRPSFESPGYIQERRFARTMMHVVSWAMGLSRIMRRDSSIECAHVRH